MTAATRLAWYAARLHSMGPAEIAGRTARAAAVALRETAGLDAAPAGPSDPAALLARFRERPGTLEHDTAAGVAGAHPDAVTSLLAAADRVREHRFRFFGLPEARSEGPIDWSEDLLTGYRWPDVASRRLDHRAGAGDPKWIWELNRLQHLPWLAEAWLLTGDDGYAEEALDQLESWVAQNPVDRGIAWRGAFEAGIRALSVVTTLQALRHSPALTPERFGRAVAMLTASARRCWRDRSLHSSANNHLVGELAGLAVVALALPELPEAAGWVRRALDGLVREADRQILPDGAGAEQAVAYQIFTADLLAVVLSALRRRDTADGGPARVLAAALDRSADHLVALVGGDDPDPRYGDDDEGFALRLDGAEVRTVRAHLATVAALTGHPGAASCGRPDLAAAWLVGAHALPDGAAPRLQSHHAPHGGLVVLRSGGRRVTVDVGPLGYLSLAAHGHADALAITLADGGRELVGDPGTASYYRHPDRRAAHRGTRAHATVAIDDLDQSTIGGPFLWTRHARTTVRSVDLAAGIVEAEHEGYTRLASPVVHRRRLVAGPADTVVVVVDLLITDGNHRVRTSWPLPPSLHVERSTHGHVVSMAGTEVLVLASAASVPWAPWEVRGDEESGLGWWSARLEAREPSWLVGGVGVTAGPVTAVATLLVPAGPVRTTVADLRVDLDADRATVRWSQRGDDGPAHDRALSVELAGAGS